ncbi:TspO/MBR family protein [Altererythrobacter aquiaggeris]|uniref:TspO/MBR family protein n=1 Tax=Aestuarierythrobacter aquiaggeris TaxID=1898396 RepID=UPI0030173FBE
MSVLASPGQLRASFFRWALFTVPLVMLLGFMSGRIVQGGPGNEWFDALTKPEIFPNPALFGIVWTVMFFLMGLSLALVCAAWGARVRTAAITAFAVQFMFVLAWTPVFFGAHEITGALVVIGVLVILVIGTTALFWQVRRLAALLLLPYLAWVIFAATLNWQFLELNPDADGAEAPSSVQRFEI